MVAVLLVVVGPVAINASGWLIYLKFQSFVNSVSVHYLKTLQEIQVLTDFPLNCVRYLLKRGEGQSYVSPLLHLLEAYV